jgi:hypothetical protein
MVGPRGGEGFDAGHFAEGFVRVRSALARVEVAMTTFALRVEAAGFAARTVDLTRTTVGDGEGTDNCGNQKEAKKVHS